MFFPDINQKPNEISENSGEELPDIKDTRKHSMIKSKNMRR